MQASHDLTAAYGEALLALGETREDVVVLDADVADSCKTDAFAERFPDRSFDLGIAEQSLPTFAAGLALCGKIPFTNCFASFAVSRSLDMIRQSVCYNRANVKIVGHCAGQSMGYTGPTHHTVEDIAALRALPNMTIVCPCDAIEMAQMVPAIASFDGPVYLRLMRSSVPNVHDDDYRFSIGKADLLAEGSDVSVFASGDLVEVCLGIREALASKGISIQVVNLPTIKPLPVEEIVDLGSKTQAAVTVEDHNVLGGMGSAVAEVYAEHLQKPLKRLGIPDRFTESDDGDKLRAKYGLGVDDIQRAITRLI